MFQRIRALFKKEVLQVIREPRMVVLLIVPPLLQLIIFGYAVNLDVETTRLAWLDRDNSSESRALRTRFEGSGYFLITETLADSREIEDVLDRGRVQAVVHLLPGFSRDIQRGRTAAVQVLVDGTNSNTASIVANYVSRVVGVFALEVGEGQLTPSAGVFSEGESSLSMRPPQVNVRSRIWFNPELKSQDYFVPGIVVNIIALVTIILTSMAVVREKEIGTMEQLMVTPIRPVELMLGKTLPFAVIGILEVAFITGASLLIFGTPLRGSVALLFFCSVLFLLTTLGAGLFISTLSGTQQQAMMGSFFFFLPAFMLSGFAFPIRNMPLAAQYFTYLNPLRYFMEIVRGIFLKGSGIEILWTQMSALAIFGVVMVVFSASRFRKRLD
jgi:ABC-2 type transport system permease protein